MKLVSGSRNGNQIPNFNPLRFGNGRTPRRSFEDAILKAGDLIYSRGDIKDKELILKALEVISNIRSNERNYQRWADLLNVHIANGLGQIWSCITTIKREAQGS